MQEAIYWDIATDTLETYHFRDIQSVDGYYHTIPPNEPGSRERIRELELKTNLIILDGHTYQIDWRDERGERHYLTDSTLPVSPMLKKLFSDVQFEKRTCGYYFRKLLF